MKVSNAPTPMYQVSYERAGKTYQSTEELFANWTPDTLDKALYNPEAMVYKNLTGLRNQTVGEALKATASDAGVGALVFVPMMTVAGTLAGVFAEMMGHQGAATVGAVAGAGFGLAVMTWAGVSEYREMRNQAGTTTCDFSGYAYRERTDTNEVKLIRGQDLSYIQHQDGSKTAGAAATDWGYCETRKLGYMPKNLPSIGID